MTSMNLNILMDKISTSIKKNSELFESNYDELISKVLKDSEQEVNEVVELNKPELWEKIYKRRDILKLKMDILNKIMSLS